MTLAATRKDIHKVAIGVKQGKRATSLDQARKLAGIQQSAKAAKQEALMMLYDLRTESILQKQRDFQKRFGQ
jgi:hypothetical protein